MRVSRRQNIPRRRELVKFAGLSHERTAGEKTASVMTETLGSINSAREGKGERERVICMRQDFAIVPRFSMPLGESGSTRLKDGRFDNAGDIKRGSCKNEVSEFQTGARAAL